MRRLLLMLLLSLALAGVMLAGVPIQHVAAAAPGQPAATASYDYDGSVASNAPTLVPATDPAIRPVETPARDSGRAYDSPANSVATNAIDDVGVAGTRATAHGSERLSQAGFTDDLVAQTKSALSTTQSDGAAVYVREVSPGRFDFIVEGERGVITAHRGWSQKAIDRLAANYGWEGWPP